MRLILVNRYFFPDESATSQLLTDLARHMADRAEVHVLASRQLLEQPGARLTAEDALGRVRIHRLWSTAFGRRTLPGRLLDYLSFLAATGLWLLLRARRGDVVLAKTDPPVLGVVTTLATLGRGVRRVQWLQDLYPETATALGVTGLAWLTRRLRDWSLRRNHLVVTVSAGMFDYVKQRIGTARLEHIPNWADDHWAPDVGPFPASSNPTGKPDKLVVGYSGNLGRAHPVEGLVRLAPLAKARPLEFLFSGGGAHHERLRAAVASCGAENWTFLPYQPREQLAELLHRPDLHLVLLDPRVERFIFPSKVYGILSAGRPILHLGGAAGELARFVREHRCGWTVPADDANALLGLLEELRTHPERLAEAGRNARAAYEQHYAAAKPLARWEKALERA